MKKKTITILLALMLLAGCEAAPATPAPIPESLPEISVPAMPESAVPEAPDEAPPPAESQEEVPPADGTPTPDEETPPAEVSDLPTEPLSAPEELPPQPEPNSAPEEVAPQETKSQPKASAASSYDGFDLKNLYPSFVWENAQQSDDDWGSEDDYEDEEEPVETFGFLREEDALEVIRLTNLERQNHGLEPLPMDENLMELARIRAMEIREQYSHTRPDGTTVGEFRCGENIGQRTSAEKQVTAWMNSEGHRTNILLERYHHIGVGCYQAENGNLYWVQVFSLD